MIKRSLYLYGIMKIFHYPMWDITWYIYIYATQSLGLFGMMYHYIGSSSEEYMKLVCKRVEILSMYLN